jgi:hypothetical protein
MNDLPQNRHPVTGQFAKGKLPAVMVPPKKTGVSPGGKEKGEEVRDDGGHG